MYGGKRDVNRFVFWKTFSKRLFGRFDEIWKENIN